MSERLAQLKAAIETPPKNAAGFYQAMKKKSEQLTNELIQRGETLPGQGCAYRGGFPV